MGSHVELLLVATCGVVPISTANIYSSDRKDNLIGGLWIAEGITNANLYSMLEIFCTFSDTFYLRHFSGRLVERDQNPLQPGDYLIATNGFITVTHELPLLRNSPSSLQAGIRSESFRNADNYKIVCFTPDTIWP
ncbi:hypothetical protein B9Z19DRAFT_1126061 [Tuber borchii]|uniref:DUF7881 domain-containing protein n=1 Tax=Tuber borchii TaxID=42251 RepID=A0A2T6ZTK5_TUBBO|nr:hypothetical protein B9Z19DRAFT_1126061 [Tuber borchii]